MSEKFSVDFNELDYALQRPVIASISWVAYYALVNDPKLKPVVENICGAPMESVMAHGQNPCHDFYEIDKNPVNVAPRQIAIGDLRRTVIEGVPDWMNSVHFNQLSLVLRFVSISLEFLERLHSPCLSRVKFERVIFTTPGITFSDLAAFFTYPCDIYIDLPQIQITTEDLRFLADIRKDCAPAYSLYLGNLSPDIDPEVFRAFYRGGRKNTVWIQLFITFYGTISEELNNRLHLLKDEFMAQKIDVAIRPFTGAPDIFDFDS